MKTWHWCLLSAVAGALAVLLLALTLWFGHGWLARPSSLHRQLGDLRELVHYSPSQTYGRLDSASYQHLLNENRRLLQTYEQASSNLPTLAGTRLLIAQCSVAEWLARPEREALRQQALRDLDRALTAIP